MMHRIYLALLIISFLAGCKDVSDKKTTGKETLKSTTKVSLADIPKKWTHLTEYENGEYVVFEPCNTSIFSYSIEKRSNQWVLNSEGTHDITTYPILNHEMNSEGDLVLTLETGDLENKEARLVIRNYSKNMKMAMFEFFYEENYEKYTNELGINEYKKIVQPCYECERYCPEGNPNFFKTIDIADNRFINPGKNVGKINYNTTPVEVSSLFQEKQLIAHSKVPFNQEETHIRLAEGNDLYIQWTEKPYLPSYVKILGDNSNFKTKEDIGIGSTIEEVEKALWTQFQIKGFEIDRDLAGTIIKWNNPEYSFLELKFKPTKELPIEQFKQIMGDNPISSSHYLLREAGLVVEEIKVFFNKYQPTGAKLYSDASLEIFDNKAYFKKKELYNGTKKLLELIDNEETTECPVSYTFSYYPLSLLGNFYSYERSEYGSVACGNSMQSTIKTIDLVTNKEVEIQDVFTETSILNALKKDSWIINKTNKVNQNVNNLNSLDDIFSFIESLDISIDKSSFAVLQKESNTSKFLVRVIGFRQNPIDKVVLGLALDKRDTKNTQNLTFGIGQFDSGVFPKK